MRVLHIIPDIGVSNGVMSVILNYAKAMPDDIIFDVLYLLDTPENKREQIEALGGKVYKLGNNIALDLLTNKFFRFFKQNPGKWEAVHIHIPYYSMFVVPAAKRANISKICCHCHSTCFSLTGKYEFVFNLLNIPTKLLVKQRYACSEEAGKFWYKKNYTVLKNAIDCNRFQYNPEIREKIRKEYDVENCLVVGHVGSTVLFQKNHEFLLRVFNEVINRNPDSVLFLVGAEKTDRLSRICEENNIQEKVFFLGLRDNVQDFLQAMDVFVFPSINEGLPVSVVEAQTTGLPCIISDSITDEVIVTDSCFSVSLNKSPLEWSNLVIKSATLPRKTNTEIMQECGWDIKNTAECLADYYITGIVNDR